MAPTAAGRWEILERCSPDMVSDSLTTPHAGRILQCAYYLSLLNRTTGRYWTPSSRRSEATVKMKSR